jgi:hypothetical protein
MDKTRPIEITEVLYAELNESCGGFCIECRDQAYGVEPDARPESASDAGPTRPLPSVRMTTEPSPSTAIVQKARGFRTPPGLSCGPWGRSPAAGAAGCPTPTSHERPSGLARRRETPALPLHASRSRQFPFDDRHHRRIIRLRTGPKPSDDRAVAVDQEFLEVPAYLAGPFRLRVQ